MNFSKILLITFFFTLVLDAAYIRTIRIGAFTSEARAKVELAKLKKFASQHQNIMDMQDEWGFEFQTRKSGKYYITIVEPLTDKKMLQRLIDTLRIKYPDAYAKKLDKLPVIKKKAPKVLVVEEKIKVVEKEIIKEVVSVPEEVEVIVPVIVEEIKEKPIEEIQIKEEDIIPFVNEKKDDVAQIQKDDYFWKISFYITLGLLVFVLLLLFLSQNKNKKQKIKEKNTELENNDKCTAISSQMQNTENFLSDAQASMSSIISYTNLLLEFETTVVQKDYIQRIKNSSETLLNTVNNNSDISRIKLGELQITNLDFNIKSMIDDIANIIKLEARQNNVNLAINFNEDIPSYVIGDSMHLRQVLVSLLTNSVKYTRNGEVTLNVKKVYSYAHAITLGFIVSDTGIGMTSEQVESIMYPEKSAISTNLAVSKQLIEMMNGDMKIYSTQDIGTTFTFNIKFDLKQ